MKILRTIKELRAWRWSLDRTEGAASKSGPIKASVGCVPTMGALHEGHLSLVRLAAQQCEHVVVSIFVNPLQFGPSEDFQQYPRPFEKDIALLERERVAAVFAPTYEEVYPKNSSTYVIEESVSQPLCGQFRPVHFRGVTTVVLKLFNLVQPDMAFFGQKDAQQCAVIERMVRDLNVPVKIIRGPTVREKDGLALSSRNAYLNPQHREKAPLIYKSLQSAAAAFTKGERNAAKLTTIGRAVLEAESAFQIQYWEIRHPLTLEPLSEVGTDGALVAVAAYLGKTRLIDNLVLGRINH